MIASLIRIVVILAAAVGVAVGYVHQFEPRLPWKYVKPPSGVEISLDEFRVLLEQGVVVIDARLPEEYAKAHLAGNERTIVLSVPEEEVWNQLVRLEPLMGQIIVLYCGSIHCDRAEQVYFVLDKMGYGPLRVYYPGWEELEKQQMPAASGPEVWNGLPPGSGGAAGEGQPPAETPANEPGSGG